MSNYLTRDQLVGDFRSLTGDRYERYDDDEVLAIMLDKKPEMEKFLPPEPSTYTKLTKPPQEFVKAVKDFAPPFIAKSIKAISEFDPIGTTDLWTDLAVKQFKKKYPEKTDKEIEDALAAQRPTNMLDEWANETIAQALLKEEELIKTDAQYAGYKEWVRNTPITETNVLENPTVAIRAITNGLPSMLTAYSAGGLTYLGARFATGNRVLAGSIATGTVRGLTAIFEGSSELAEGIRYLTQDKEVSIQQFNQEVGEKVLEFKDLNNNQKDVMTSQFINDNYKRSGDSIIKKGLPINEASDAVIGSAMLTGLGAQFLEGMHIRNVWHAFGADRALVGGTFGRILNNVEKNVRKIPKIGATSRFIRGGKPYYKLLRNSGGESLEETLQYLNQVANQTILPFGYKDESFGETFDINEAVESAVGGFGMGSLAGGSGIMADKLGIVDRISNFSKLVGGTDVGEFVVKKNKDKTYSLFYQEGEEFVKYSDEISDGSTPTKFSNFDDALVASRKLTNNFLDEVDNLTYQRNRDYVDASVVIEPKKDGKGYSVNIMDVDGNTLQSDDFNSKRKAKQASTNYNKQIKNLKDIKAKINKKAEEGTIIQDSDQYQDVALRALMGLKFRNETEADVENSVIENHDVLKNPKYIESILESRGDEALKSAGINKDDFINEVSRNSNYDENKIKKLLETKKSKLPKDLSKVTVATYDKLNNQDLNSVYNYWSDRLSESEKSKDKMGIAVAKGRLSKLSDVANKKGISFSKETTIPTTTTKVEPKTIIPDETTMEEYDDPTTPSVETISPKAAAKIAKEKMEKMDEYTLRSQIKLISDKLSKGDLKKVDKIVQEGRLKRYKEELKRRKLKDPLIESRPLPDLFAKDISKKNQKEIDELAFEIEKDIQDGKLTVDWHQKDPSRIGNIEVKEDLRGKGLGSSTYKKIEKIFKLQNKDRINIKAKPTENTVNFWKKMGFIVVGKGKKIVDEYGVPRVHMSKIISGKEKLTEYKGKDWWVEKTDDASLKIGDLQTMPNTLLHESNRLPKDFKHEKGYKTFFAVESELLKDIDHPFATREYIYEVSGKPLKKGAIKSFPDREFFVAKITGEKDRIFYRIVDSKTGWYLGTNANLNQAIKDANLKAKLIKSKGGPYSQNHWKEQERNIGVLIGELQPKTISEWRLNSKKETQQVKLEINKDQILETAKKDILGNRPNEVIINELLQNSIDAGSTEISIKVTKSDTYGGFVITVVDNGSGMTPDEFKKHMLVYGNVGSKDEKSAGGYGRAKAGFLLFPERVSINTAKNGLNTSLFVTNEELVTGSFPINVSSQDRFKKHNGTTIQLYLNEIDVYDIKRAVKNHIKTIKKDLKIKFNVSLDSYQDTSEEHTLKPIQMDDIIHDSINIESNGSQVEIHFVKDDNPSTYAWAGQYPINTMLLNKGLPLHKLSKDKFKGYGLKGRESNFKIFINFKKTPLTSDKNYPFLNNRTNIRSSIYDDIDNAIKERIKTLNDEFWTSNLNEFEEVLNNTRNYGGVRFIIPVKEGLSALEHLDLYSDVFDLLDSNKNVMESASLWLNDFRSMLEGFGEEGKNVGFTAEKGLLGFRTNTDLGLPEFLAINPFEIDRALMKWVKEDSKSDYPKAVDRYFKIDNVEFRYSDQNDKWQIIYDEKSKEDLKTLHGLYNHHFVFNYGVEYLSPSEAAKEIESIVNNSAEGRIHTRLEAKEGVKRKNYANVDLVVYDMWRTNVYLKESNIQKKDLNRIKASAMVHTLIHEYAHRKGKGHDTAHSYEIARLYSLFTHKELNKLEDKIYAWYQSQESQIGKIQSELKQIYKRMDRTVTEIRKLQTSRRSLQQFSGGSESAISKLTVGRFEEEIGNARVTGSKLETNRVIKSAWKHLKSLSKGISSEANIDHFRLAMLDALPLELHEYFHEWYRNEVKKDSSYELKKTAKGKALDVFMDSEDVQSAVIDFMDGVEEGLDEIVSKKGSDERAVNLGNLTYFHELGILIESSQMASLNNRASRATTFEGFIEEAFVPITKRPVFSKTGKKLITDRQYRGLLLYYNRIQSSLKTNSENGEYNERNNYEIDVSNKGIRFRQKGPENKRTNNQNNQYEKVTLFENDKNNRLLFHWIGKSDVTEPGQALIDSNGNKVANMFGETLYSTRVKYDFLNPKFDFNKKMIFDMRMLQNTALRKNNLTIAFSAGDRSSVALVDVRKIHYNKAKNAQEYWDNEFENDYVTKKQIKNFMGEYLMKRANPIKPDAYFLASNIAVHEAMKRVLPKYLELNGSEVFKRLKIPFTPVTISKNLRDIKVKIFNPKNVTFRMPLGDRQVKAMQNIDGKIVYIGDGGSLTSKSFFEDASKSVGSNPNVGKLKTVIYNKVGDNVLAVKHMHYLPNRKLEIYDGESMIASIDNNGNIIDSETNEIIDVLMTKDEAKISQGFDLNKIHTIPGSSVGFITLDDTASKNLKHPMQWYNHVTDPSVIEAFKNNILRKVNIEIAKIYSVAQGDTAPKKVLEHLQKLANADTESFYPVVLELAKLGGGLHPSLEPMLNVLLQTGSMNKALTIGFSEGTKLSFVPNWDGRLDKKEIGMSREASKIVFEKYAIANDMLKANGKPDWRAAKSLPNRDINTWLRNNVVDVFVSRTPIPHAGGAGIFRVKFIHSRNLIVEMNPYDTFTLFEGDYDGDSLHIEFLDDNTLAVYKEFFNNLDSEPINLTKYTDKKQQFDLSKLDDRFNLMEALTFGKNAIGEVATMQSVYGQLLQVFDSITIDGNKITLRQPDEIINFKGEKMRFDKYLRILLQAAADNAEFLLLKDWNYSVNAVQSSIFKKANAPINEDEMKILKQLIRLHKMPRHVVRGSEWGIRYKLDNTMDKSENYFNYTKNRTQYFGALVDNPNVSIQYKEGVTAPIEDLAIAPYKMWTGYTTKWGIIGHENTPVRISNILHENTHLSTMEIMEKEHKSKMLRNAMERDLKGVEATSEEKRLALRGEVIEGVKYVKNMANSFYKILQDFGEIGPQTIDRNEQMIEWKEKYHKQFNELSETAQLSASFKFLERWFREGVQEKVAKVFPPVSKSKSEYSLLSPKVIETYFTEYNSFLKEGNRRLDKRDKGPKYKPMENMIKDNCKKLGI